MTNYKEEILMNENYKLINAQLKGLLSDCNYHITDLSNASALLFQSLEDVNWAGFYLMRDNKLILGPFQGRTACMEIAIGKGVCGTAVETDSIQRIADVHQFPGHIACDCASNSEIVIPIHSKGEIIGVLDIDSPIKNRFLEEDEIGLLEFVTILEEKFKNGITM